MSRPAILLIALGREALLLSQQELAELVGSSLRTVQRWEAGRATPLPVHLQRLADAVRPRDPGLADEIDELAPRPAPPTPLVVVSASQTIPPPAPHSALSPLHLPAQAATATAARGSPPVADAILVDAVVCAAAEALSMMPQAARPAVLAAFTRARAARLTIEAVIAVLAPAAPG